MSQLWGTDTLGGFMYSDELSDVLRTALQPMVRFRQFCDVKEGKNEGKGDQLYWNVYSDVADDGDELVETNAMPETNFTVRQESLTVTEFGNSVPFTMKLDNLSKHSVTEVIHKVLKNDARKTLDRAAHAQFELAPTVITPAETSTPGTGDSTTDVVFTDAIPPAAPVIPAQNDAAMTKEHVKAISDGLKERNVIPFDGEHYGCIARPSTYRPFKDQLEQVYQYVDQGFGIIYNGEYGRYEGIRFIEQTNIASEGWANGKSDAAYFFGLDTVAEGIVIPEEIRGKIPTDYGRSKGVAWYYLGGFGICHTDPANARIFKWASDE